MRRKRTAVTVMIPEPTTMAIVEAERHGHAEKRPPQFKGWDVPEDRCRLPKLDRQA
jgi:hypothetical protein